MDNSYNIYFKLINSNSNNNKNNNYNDNNDKLFFLVWKNKYILSIIFQHLKLFLKYKSMLFDNTTDYLLFPFREYIYSLTIKVYNNDIKGLKIMESSKLSFSVPYWTKEFKIGTNKLIKSNHIPEHIEVLKFELCFEQPLKGLLQHTKNLKTLSLGHYFRDEILPGDLPPTLTTLIFDGCQFGRTLKPQKNPQSYTFRGSSYNIEFQRGVFPESLTHLELSEDYNHKFQKDVLPKSLKKLIFGFWYISPIENLPPSLEYIRFGHQFGTTGDFNNEFSQLSDSVIKDNSLPNSLKYLEFGACFNCPIKPNQLPNGIEILKFGMGWSQPLSTFNLFTLSNKSIIPSSCTHLEIKSLNLKIENNDIPPSVKTLIILNRNHKTSCINLNSNSIKVIFD